MTAVTQLTAVTYTQSGVDPACNPASYGGMNDGTADASTNLETGTDPSQDSFLQADCGSTVLVNHVVVGYDATNSLPGNWGSAAFNGATLAASADGVTWTQVATLDDAAAVDGLVSISVGSVYRYLRITSYPQEWLGITEFEVWGSEDSSGGGDAPSDVSGTSVIVNQGWQLCVQAAALSAGAVVTLPDQLASDWFNWGSVHQCPPAAPPVSTTAKGRKR
jgi:hypothetical protein